jgi:uncharacterized protein YgbK (DUF1537 family)
VTVIVGDAETDRDLEAWVAALGGAGGTDDARPLVLAGSMGLASACRSLPREAWPTGAGEAVAAPGDRAERRGVLVVSGSAHPATRAQLAHAAAAAGLAAIGVDPGRPADAGAEAARRLADDGTTALVAPEGEVAGGSAAVLAAVATAAAAALGRVRPRALVIVGGETAFAVLATLGHPRLRVDGPAPAPLVACATILDGAVAGTRLVTKGGSSGPAERLTALLAEARR